MNKWIIRVIYITISIILIFGCNLVSRTPPEMPGELMINQSADLSGNYELKDMGIEEIEDGNLFYRTYEKKAENIGSIITHQISIYSDTETARNKFSFYEERLFTDIWIMPPSSNFEPIVSDDYYVYKCHDTQNDSYSCRVIQQHQNLLIIIFVNINEKNISFSEFDEILESLDSRLPEEEILGY
ncbi:MAG: hypothetical protein JEZ06_23555 [Anaerolineaceae bacterium]|nr:hypothetical protein [Anaerolineaceae bacterium]